MPMLIANPKSVKGTKEPVQTVLRVLAGQEGCDGEPYDQMMQAAHRIDQLEIQLGNMLTFPNNEEVRYIALQILRGNV